MLLLPNHQCKIQQLESPCILRGFFCNSSLVKMHLSKLLPCLVAMASSSTAAINVWLYSLSEYRGDVFGFDGDSHTCSTVGEEVYNNVQSAKIVHFEPFPYFVCTLFR
ncbi:hypothetical protein GGI43DRAFT_148481 [Trichoderma evansii]